MDIFCYINTHYNIVCAKYNLELSAQKAMSIINVSTNKSLSKLNNNIKKNGRLFYLFYKLFITIFNNFTNFATITIVHICLNKKLKAFVSAYFKWIYTDFMSSIVCYFLRHWLANVCTGCTTQAADWLWLLRCYGNQRCWMMCNIYENHPAVLKVLKDSAPSSTRPW